MSDPQHASKTGSYNEGASLFSVPPEERPQRKLLLAAAGAIVLIAVLGGAAFVHGRHPEASRGLNAELPLDSYASKLEFTQPAMSQSTSLAGGTSTFIDGHVRNMGSQTVTGVTLQVLFRNDEGLAPQVETLPLSLIRTHEPYVDTEPVGAAPLQPGDYVEFRLIFESIPANWNQQLPEIRVVRVTSR